LNETSACESEMEIHSEEKYFNPSKGLNFHQKRSQFTKNIEDNTCFIQKIYDPSSSLLQGKHLPFTPSPLRLNIVCLIVILTILKAYFTFERR
jgi:hypothetical protein